jgi:ubiquinone/menaquinone biosynthesis C-methylase UbiE
VHPAFRTWEAVNESLESVEARIHDGVPRTQLHERADVLLDTFAALFPGREPAPGSDVMEIGSGVAYIMEAAMRRYAPRRIVGLDIAAGMIEKAQLRLERDGVDTRAVEFVHYDGVNVPLPSASFDLIYSVSALQHAPRPYCFRALIEANRLVRPGGTVFVHLLSYAHLGHGFGRGQFIEEIDRQIRDDEGHWHHFYSSEEIDAVLRYGVDVKDLEIVDQGGALYIAFSG